MVGVLALQGDYEAHERKLHELNQETLRVVSAEQLDRVDSLVIPGGESSVFLKLLSPELKARIVQRAETGMPILATCAGTILIAKNVENPSQESLGLIDIDVRRNAYGRQIDSFISREIRMTLEGCKILDTSPTNDIEGVFIRAPKITRVGTNVSSIFTLNEEVVGACYKNILALTFHPELSSWGTLLYRFLISH